MTSSAVQRRRRPFHDSPQQGASILAAFAVVVVLGLITLVPIYWLVVTALTPDADAFAFPPDIFPHHPTLDNFIAFFTNDRLRRYFMNSVVVTLASTALALVVSAYCAYSLSKFRYRGRKALMYFVLSTQLFPASLLIISLYGLFNAYGMLNTYPALVLSFTTFTLPLCTFILKSYFDTIPTELVEAAKLDGASQVRIIHRVVLPVSAPGLIVAGLFAVIRSWNDFLLSLTLGGQDTRTLPPGLVLTYLSQDQSSWTGLMAASIIVSIPVIVVFLVFQRHFVAGALSGSVTG